MNADVLTTTVADGIAVITLGSTRRIYFDEEMGDTLTEARDLQWGILRQGHGAVREHGKTSNRRHLRHMPGRWIRVRALLRFSYR